MNFKQIQHRLFSGEPVQPMLLRGTKLYYALTKTQRASFGMVEYDYTINLYFDGVVLQSYDWFEFKKEIDEESLWEVYQNC